jgi:hypothetical protein
MPASNVRAIEQPDDALRQSYAEWTTLYKGNLDAVMASSQAVISGCQSVGTELLAFYQSRMKNGLEASQRLAQCSSPEAAVELHIDLAKSALKAYVDEFRKVGDLTGKIMTDAVAPLRARASQIATKAEESVAA